MKKLLFLFSVFLFVMMARLNAQSNYQSAIGLRAGSPFSFSYKHFLTEPGAVELYAGTGSHTFQTGAMYQHHFPIGSVEGLQWYIGGGAFVRFYSYNDYTATNLGINGIGGVDYKFPNIPLNISADWMPSFVFGDSDNIDYGSAGYGAVSVRYVLK